MAPRAALGAVATGLLLAAALPAAALEFEDVALEGQLRFLAERPDPDAYRYDAVVQISPDSLQTGVVDIQTCHRQLDPNRRVVVQFNAQRVQSLQVTQSTGMDSARVEGTNVELANVQRGGSVCIALRSRALEQTGEGRWRLHAGPLMRRYLDGYLPMDAQLQLRWPAGLLQVQSTQPAPQPGVRLSQHPEGAQLDLTFAGRMRATWELGRP